MVKEMGNVRGNNPFLYYWGISSVVPQMVSTPERHASV